MVVVLEDVRVRTGLELRSILNGHLSTLRHSNRRLRKWRPQHPRFDAFYHF